MSPNLDQSILYRCYMDDVVTRSNGSTANSHSELGNYPGYRMFRVTTSERTPNFRRLKASQVPWHPYTYNYWNYSAPVSTYIHKAEQGTDVHISTYQCTACYLGVSDGSFPSSFEADDPTQRAISELAKAASNQKASTPVALAEAAKTASSVAKTATKLAKAIMALRSGRFGDFTGALGITASASQRARFKRRYPTRNASGDTVYRSYSSAFKRKTYETRMRDFMASTWLEYSYGWKPLLKDVYDHAEALATVLSTSSGVMRRAHGSAKTDHATKLVEDDGFKLKTTTAMSRKKVKFVVEYRIPDGAVSPAVAFGLTNPYVVPWELLPFSFVVDWFIPIGQALEALTSFDGLVFHRGSKSFVHEFERHVSFAPNGKRTLSGGVYYTVLSASPKFDEVRYYKTRSLLTSFPSYGMPRFKDPRSFAHAASAVALLQSVFLGKR